MVPTSNATHSNGTITPTDSTTKADSNGTNTPPITNNENTIYQFHATDENRISYEVVVYIVIALFRYPGRMITNKTIQNEAQGKTMVNPNTFFCFPWASF